MPITEERTCLGIMKLIAKCDETGRMVGVVSDSLIRFTEQAKLHLNINQVILPLILYN